MRNELTRLFVGNSSRARGYVFYDYRPGLVRIGIDFRILELGQNLITRGMGRYTQQQLREVLAIDSVDEYLLLCLEESDLSLILPEIRSAPNVEIRSFAQSTPDQGEVSLLRLADEYLEWVDQWNLDLYHLTAPFLGERPELVCFDVCPMIATFYDLIPFLFSERYLARGWAARYHRTLDLVRTADRLLAISDSAGSDAAVHLGFSKESIDRAWPIAEAIFRPLTDLAKKPLLDGIQRRIRLPEHFVLSVADTHYSKNLDTLFEAYSHLSPTFRTRLPLVVCCALNADGFEFVQKFALDARIADDVMITGRVSDEELCALYNQATVVVHPSRYEGFGLPVLEAMQCGASVVTTTASSLPEVAGDAAILVDPEDSRALSEAIAHLAISTGARRELGERAMERAKTFSPRQLGESTLRAYRATTMAPDDAKTHGRHRVAILGALPPSSDPLAGNNAELIHALSPTCDVEVFVEEGILPHQALLSRFTVHHRSAFNRRAKKVQPELVLLRSAHSENSELAAVLGRSAGLGVLSSAEVDRIRRKYPGSDPRLVPLGVSDPRISHPGLTRETARCLLKWDPEAFVIGVVGTLGRAAGLESCIRECELLGEEVPKLKLLVAGPAEDKDYVVELLELAASVRFDQEIEFLGDPRGQTRLEWIAACDVILSLRSADHGASSIARLWSMALGKPIIRIGSPGHESEEAAGPMVEAYEATVLAELRRLANDPETVARAGAQERARYEQEGFIGGTVHECLDLIEATSGSGAPSGRSGARV